MNIQCKLSALEDSFLYIEYEYKIQYVLWSDALLDILTIDFVYSYNEQFHEANSARRCTFI